MLDTNQMEAVSFSFGPCLCLAGPGSGKTTVLTNRIVSLIKEQNIPSEKILVITFTKDAATEMRERFIKLMDGEGTLVNFGTFHSVFYAILREEMHFTNADLLGEYDKKKLIFNLAKKLKLKELSQDTIDEIVKEIGFVKNAKVDLSNYKSTALETAEFVAIFQQYELYKENNHMIDFDDMLTKTLDLFLNNKDVLKKWQQKFSFYLIDEMQDMNDLQFEIIKLMAIDENIFAVGDDDQSIYGFRGANPKIMREFSEFYSECTTIRLSTNYRCKKKIVESAKNLISYNENRFEKEINAFSNEEGSVLYIEAENAEDEADKICEIITQIYQKHGYDKKIAILFRNHVQCLPIVSGLSKRSIPFAVKERMNNIFDHWIALDIESYIRIVCNKATRADFVRVLNHPNRYISRTSIDNIKSLYDLLLIYKDQDWILPRIRVLLADINRIKNLSTYPAINYIRHGMGYEEYLLQVATKNGQKLSEYQAILDEVYELARQYPNKDKFLEKINEIRELVKITNQKKKVITDGVSLNTFHGSKGLEFDVVFILNCNEDIVPSKRAVSKEMLEEERRMFYVALTRAKSELYLCTIKRQGDTTRYPSRFLKEIVNEKLISLPQGTAQP